MRIKISFTISEIISFFIVICVYIRSGSPFSLAYQSTTLFLLIVASGIIIARSVLRSPRERLSFPLVTFATVYCVTLLVTMFLTHEITLYRNYFVQLLMCIDALLILKTIGVEKTIRYWIVSMRVVVVAALILYGLIILGITSFPTIHTASAEYYTIFVASQLQKMVRLSGTFWEPSMLVVFLSITIIFELLAKENESRNKRIWIFIESVALLLTVSTSAVVALMLIAFIYLNRDYRSGKLHGGIIIGEFVLCLLFILFYDLLIMRLYELFPSVFYKLVEKDISFLTRVNNPIGDIMACIYNPLGVGVEHVEEVVRQYAILATGDIRAVISRTSTWSYYFAAFGWIAGLSVNLIWITGIIKCCWLNGIQKLAFGVLVLYLLTSVTLVNNQLYWIFIVLINVSSQRRCFGMKELLYAEDGAEFA